MSDLTKHAPKVHKVTKILEKMLVETPNDAELPKLIKTMDDCSDKHSTIMMWAERFSLAEPASKKRRKSSCNAYKGSCNASDVNVSVLVLLLLAIVQS